MGILFQSWIDGMQVLKENKNFNKPVLFLIFNRPDLTEEVFEEIRQAQPKQLFIAADGARNEKERILCEQTRKIIEKVDWDCKVETLFREENLGCQKAVSSAIDWFFEHVEEGIILEDDCVPSQSFFVFCQELLNYYRDTSQVMHIAGHSHIEPKHIKRESYYFSPIQFCWGWATWKRAWKFFDVEMKNYSQLEEGIRNTFSEKYRQDYWLDILKKVESGKINSWAYIWTFTIFAQNGLCVTPVKNLITNIGFEKSATHTKGISNLANRKSYEINRIVHPKTIIYDKKMLELNMKKIFGVERFKKQKNIIIKIIKKIKNI